jgi:hypothetical protein
MKDRLIPAAIAAAFAAYLFVDGMPVRLIPFWVAGLVVLWSVPPVLARYARQRTPRARRAGFPQQVAGAADRVRLVTTATYGDVARLWLTGEQRRELHGLQPQPAVAPELVSGQLVITDALATAPPSPLPILVLHRASLEPGAPELVRWIGLDGQTRWETRFPTETIGRARTLVVAADDLVLELGPTATANGRRGRGGGELLALAIATGEPRWDTPPARQISDRLGWTLFGCGVVGVAVALILVFGVGLRSFVGFAAVLGVIALIVVLTEHRGRADRISTALVMPGEVMVIDDAIAAPVGHTIGVTDEHRLTTWRLSDGRQLARIAGPRELRLVGAAPKFVWCASHDMPIHARDPSTLAVVHDAVVLAKGGDAFARDGGTDVRPLYDERSGGVHVFTTAGRGLLISPALELVETPRAEVEPARHAPACRDGRLQITQLVDRDDRPALALRSTDRGETLTFTSAATSWDARFRASTISRATHLFVTPTRVVFVIGPSPIVSTQVGDEIVTAGGGEGHVALALDAATGSVAWRARL